MGRAKFLKNFIIGFWEVLIFEFCGYQYWKICWLCNCNCSNRNVLFISRFILQIVNILVLLFWNVCVLDKLRYCFLNLKGRLKTIKNHNHYCCWYQYYYKCHFYHYFHVVHYRWINWITWTYTQSIFPFTFDCKSSCGKNKITPIDLSPPRTQTRAQYCSQLNERFCKVVIFNIHRSRL